MKNLLRLSGIFVFFIANIFSSTAQNTSVSIGNWREHIAYNKGVDVAEDGHGLVYCASQFGLYSFSKNDGELYSFSRLKELSDLEIATIKYDQTTGVLLIAYQSSNIDLIYSDKTIVNLPDIKQKNIVGGKRINSVFFTNGFAYLACEFGIVVVDLNRREIKDTYYIGPNGSNINVNGIAFDGATILAATDSGVFTANYYDPNIFNYTSWSRDLTLSEPGAAYTSTTFFNGKFFLIKTNPAPNLDTLLVKDNGQWIPFITNPEEGAHVDSYNNYLIYRNNSGITVYDGAANVIAGANKYDAGFVELRRGFLDNQGVLWIADYFNGLVRKNPDGYVAPLCPNGPRSASAWALDSRNGRLWVASGAMLGDGPNPNEKNGVYYFSDNTWKTFESGTTALINVTVDPNDADHAFIGSWGSGVLEYHNNGDVTHYTESNSAMHSHSCCPGYLIVGGISYDEDGNVWIAAGGNTNSISVLKKDGSSQSFVIPEIAVSGYGLYGMTIDDFGQKWFIAREGASTGQGLCVMKESSLDNPNNVSFKRLNDRAGFGSLPDMFVRAVTKDKDGVIWIGTNTGVAVIYNPGNVFTGGQGSYDAQKIILQQDGYNQYLLETEIVTSIVVDGANRKWIGTYSGGVFLMSPDGTHQILNFNKDNSPLASNSIQSIAIDDKTGEVFFATDKGIISYRGDATEGGDRCSDYYVFPNPVRHEYHDPIAVRGLVQDADVKITDVAGNVVFHTKANGGEAIWNGNNFRGERVQTGVYIVYVTNEDGSETCTTKLLFGN